MSEYVPANGISIARNLFDFVNDRVLPDTGMDEQAFWSGAADIFARFAPRNAALLALRDELQSKIDAWHLANRGQPHDAEAYQRFLSEIGYLVPEPAPFAIGTANVDPEIATMAGPQ